MSESRKRRRDRAACRYARRAGRLVGGGALVGGAAGSGETYLRYLLTDPRSIFRLKVGG